MIQVLFALIFAEMALIVLFIFKNPLRKTVIMGLDRIKRGSGPIVVQTVGGTVFVVMLATLYNAVAIKRRQMRDATTDSTDQILCARHLLGASLMGNCSYKSFLFFYSAAEILVFLFSFEKSSRIE